MGKPSQQESSWPPSMDDLFAPSQKIPLTKATFLAYILPAILCLYVMAILVQLQGTRFYRFALLPVLVWFAWHGMFVDMSGGDPKQAQSNTAIVTNMISFSLRGTVWALAREPFRRQSPPGKREYSSTDSENIYTAMWNAGDLLINTRGVGWSWSRGLVFPKYILETDSRIVFVLLSAARSALYVLGIEGCVQVMRTLSPDGFGSINGGSLFDHTLPPHIEILRAIFVSFLTIWTAYFAIQFVHQLGSIILVSVFRYHPSQCPPLFDSPWLSTSLTEFWGRRWHQMMRELLVPLGIRQIGNLFGRLGGVFAAFVISGLFHDIELRSFGRGGNTVAVAGFWVMSGVGVVLERLWTRATGRRVGGIVGWTWTFGWLALWGVWVANEWAKAGRFGALSMMDMFW